MHRHLPSSFHRDVLESGRRPFSELCARLRALTDDGLVKLGPVEPLQSSDEDYAQETQRFQVWVIDSPNLNYRQLRVLLGEENIALRVHVIEHSAHAVNELCRTRNIKVDAIVINADLPGLQARDLVASIRARRQLRRIPVFACDTSYTAQRSRELYGAGANGYLCGQVATRQLGAALVRTLGRPAVLRTQLA